MSELKKIERDDNGLIKGIDYKFDSQGLIDWRKMIEPQYLVVNKQNFEKRGQPIPESIDGLEDKDLLILLQGIKVLAGLRGIKSVTYHLASPSIEYVAAICQVIFTANYESEHREITFSAIGDAHYNNTKDFGRNFLAACAENRAFVRAIRNYLRISIISSEEMGRDNQPEQKEESSFNAVTLLNNLMKSKGFTFNSIKKKLVLEKFEGAENFNSTADIPPFKIYELINRITEAKGKV